jgi:hypothetical protein
MRFDYPWQMPAVFIQEVESWPEAYKSPYGPSYYSMPGKTWEHTPEGILRVADHWNFANHQFGIQCPTDRKVGKKSWAMGRWEGDRFTIVRIVGRPKLTELSATQAAKLDVGQMVQWARNMRYLDDNVHWLSLLTSDQHLGGLPAPIIERILRLRQTQHDPITRRLYSDQIIGWKETH